MTYKFALELLELLVKRERLVNAVELDTSKFETFIMELTSVNNAIASLPNQCAIADIGDLYSYFQDVIKTESKVAGIIVQLNEGTEKISYENFSH